MPGEPRSPFVTSGLRIGTPAITTRGFNADDSRALAGLICDVLDDLGNTKAEAQARNAAAALCARYPVYRS